MGDPLIFEQFYHKFNEDVLSTGFTQSEIDEIKRGTRKDYEIDSSEKNADACRAFDNTSGVTFFELFLSAMKILRDVSRENEDTIWGIKEIWCEDFLPAFLSQDHVTIKCIHMIRDPRAVVVSRNYGKYLHEGCGGQKYPVLFIARSWRRSVELYRKLYGNDNYLPIRYEDLVISPEKILKKICDFLGIHFNPIMLDYSQYRAGDKQAWRGNIASRQFNCIDSSSAARWREIISGDDVFLCEFLCAREMKSIGYELITDYQDVGRFQSIQEDASVEKSWLCDYGHCLNGKQKEIEISRIG
jgi:hypothetical protein